MGYSRVYNFNNSNNKRPPNKPIGNHNTRMKRPGEKYFGNANKNHNTMRPITPTYNHNNNNHNNHNNHNNGYIIPVCKPITRHPQNNNSNIQSTYVQRQNNYEFQQNINHIKQSCSNNCSAEIECLEEKQNKTSRLIKNLNIEIDSIGDTIGELESKVNKISYNNNHDNKCEKIGGIIKKLGLECMEFYLNQIGDTCITIEGIYKTSKLKVVDTKGLIKFYTDQIPFNEISCEDVMGSVSILNLDNKTMYSGLITYDSGLQYILSNRPIVPLGVPFSAIVKIRIKIYLCS